MPGTLKDLGDGRWQLRVFVGRDARGRVQHISRNFRGGKRAAQKELAALVSKVGSGAVVKHSCSVAELLDRWLHAKKTTLTRRSYHEYERTVERDLKPALGEIKLDKLSSQHLDRFYQDQLGKGLAPATVRKQAAYLAGALNQAVKWDLIVRNPADKASPPVARKKRVRPPKVEDVRRMVGEAERTNPVLAVALVIASVTGARRGELCALRWSHVNWDGHTITFEESLTHLDGETTLGDTKSHQWRTLSMEAPLEARLRRRRQEQENYAFLVGVNLVEDPYVLSQVSDGSLPYKPDTLSQAYRRAAKRAGIHSHIHELRHFSATTAIASGADVRTVASRLGHAQTSTTLNIYADALEQLDRQLAGVLEGAVLGTMDGCQEADAGNAPTPT